MNTNFRNTPNLKDENGNEKVKRYVHQPLSNDHYGIHFSIQKNGRVIIRSQPTPVVGNEKELEYDEVEVPASLIFKLAMLLKSTRTIEYVSVSEAKSFPEVE